MEKVSIIVPIHNVENYLQECLDSICQQTYPNFEVILVENGSEDTSLEIAKKYLAYPNVSLITTSEKLGPGGARNWGMQKATGDYFAFIDADDIIASEMVETLMHAMKKTNTRVGMCKRRNFLGKYRKQKDNSSKKIQVINFQEKPEALEEISGHCWNKIYHRSLFKKLSFPSHITFEDAPLTYPILVEAGKMVYVDQELYYYRRNFSGITLSNKLIPRRGILDLYISATILEENYQLVKKDARFKFSIPRIEHSLLLISALDSAFWFSIPWKEHRRITTLFLTLANQKYGYEEYRENPLVSQLQKRTLYKVRSFLLDIVREKHFEEDLTEEEILTELNNRLDQIVSEKEKKKKLTGPMSKTHS